MEAKLSARGCWQTFSRISLMFMLFEVFFFLAFLEDLHHITCMNVICYNIQWTKLYNLEIRESLPPPCPPLLSLAKLVSRAPLWFTRWCLDSSVWQINPSWLESIQIWTAQWAFAHTGHLLAIEQISKISECWHRGQRLLHMVENYMGLGAHLPLAPDCFSY